MKLFLKSVLQIFTLLIALLLLGAVLFALIITKDAYEHSMLVPVVIASFGFFSVLFHQKTKEFYKKDSIKIMTKKMRSYFLFHIVFLVMLLFLIIFICNILVGVDNDLNFVSIIFIVIFSLPIIGNMIDFLFLAKKLKENKRALNEQVDDIKGIL